AVWLILALLIAACSAPAAPSPAASKPGAASPTTSLPASTSPAASQPPSAANPASSQPAAAAAAVTPVPATLQVGPLLLLIDAPISLAIERGYFNEVGITLDLQQFDSIANEIPLLGTGQLDIALEGASSAGFFNALARGVALKMVATQGAAWEGHTFNGIVAARPLLDTGQVKRVADLRGKTVNILLEGVFAQLMVDKALAADGLSLADVQQQKVPFPDTLAALRNQSLDASFLVEPFITLGKQ